MVNWDVYGRYNELVHGVLWLTGMFMVDMCIYNIYIYNELVNGVYKPTYNCRAPSCGFANKNGDVFILEIVTSPARLGVFTKNHGSLNQTWSFFSFK